MIDTRALDRLRSVESGMISDCMMRLGLHGWMDGLLPVGGGPRRAVGPARTLLFGPKRGEGAWSKTMYATIASLQPGDVLVFGAGGTKENLMGDNMANFAAAHGLAAMVTDSPVRDSIGIAEAGLPVYAKGPAVRLPLNLEPIALDVPIVCAGAQVRPGDIVVGCEDGVLTLPPARVDDLLFQLEEVEMLEGLLQQAIRDKASLSAIEDLVKRKKVKRTA